MRMNKGQAFLHVEADTEDAPVFSEAFLYERVGKGDARFILGVAEEYEHVVNALGPAAVIAILSVRVRLVQRLEVGKAVTDLLQDALSDRDLDREARYPSQVILPGREAHSVWGVLHGEYRRYFDPEASMDSDRLRTYLLLTDLLGSHEQEMKARVDAERPAMTERAHERRAEREATKRRLAETQSVALAALRGEGDPVSALALCEKAWAEEE